MFWSSQSKHKLVAYNVWQDKGNLNTVTDQELVSDIFINQTEFQKDLHKSQNDEAVRGPLLYYDMWAPIESTA